MIDFLIIKRMHKRMACKRQRVVLTPKLAKEIYKRKLVLLTQTGSEFNFNGLLALKGQSVPIAHVYNVSAKTIRDIWNRKTWKFATRELWCEEEDETAGTHVSTAQVDLMPIMAYDLHLCL